MPILFSLDRGDSVCPRTHRHAMKLCRGRGALPCGDQTCRLQIGRAVNSPRLALDRAGKNGACSLFPSVAKCDDVTYSSWLNQVELWFAKIQRDVISRGVFTSVADLGRKLRKYIRAYAKSAKPFRWTYTDPSRRIRPNKIIVTAYSSGSSAPSQTRPKSSHKPPG